MPQTGASAPSARGLAVGVVERSLFDDRQRLAQRGGTRLRVGCAFSGGAGSLGGPHIGCGLDGRRDLGGRRCRRHRGNGRRKGRNRRRGGGEAGGKLVGDQHIADPLRPEARHLHPDVRCGMLILDPVEQ